MIIELNIITQQKRKLKKLLIKHYIDKYNLYTIYSYWIYFVQMTYFIYVLYLLEAPFLVLIFTFIFNLGF